MLSVQPNPFELLLGHGMSGLPPLRDEARHRSDPEAENWDPSIPVKKDFPSPLLQPRGVWMGLGKGQSFCDFAPKNPENVTTALHGAGLETENGHNRMCGAYWAWIQRVVDCTVPVLTCRQ